MSEMDFQCCSMPRKAKFVMDKDRNSSFECTLKNKSSNSNSIFFLLSKLVCSY